MNRLFAYFRSPLVFNDHLLHPDDALRRANSDRFRHSIRRHGTNDPAKLKSRSFDETVGRDVSAAKRDGGARHSSDDRLYSPGKFEIFIESPSGTERRSANFVRSSSWRRKQYATTPQATVHSSSDEDNRYVELSHRAMEGRRRPSIQLLQVQPDLHHSDVNIAITSGSEYCTEEEVSSLIPMMKRIHSGHLYCVVSGTNSLAG